MQQVAADTLGLAPDKVTLWLGDTRLPASPASVGSATMTNAGASVMLAAKAARDRAIELSLTGGNAPFAGAVRDDVVVSDGMLVLARKNLNITYVELLARNGLATLVGARTRIRGASERPKTRPLSGTQEKPPCLSVPCGPPQR
jgi:xanthine dehydrogenase YagR molybdenum-binding subunit